MLDPVDAVDTAQGHANFGTLIVGNDDMDVAARNFSCGRRSARAHPADDEGCRLGARNE